MLSTRITGRSAWARTSGDLDPSNPRQLRSEEEGTGNSPAWVRSSGDQERQQPALPAHQGVRPRSTTRQVGVGAQLRRPGPQQPALSAHRATRVGGQHRWVRSSGDLDLRSPHYLLTEQRAGGAGIAGCASLATRHRTRHLRVGGLAGVGVVG